MPLDQRAHVPGHATGLPSWLKTVRRGGSPLGLLLCALLVAGTAMAEEASSATASDVGSSARGPEGAPDESVLGELLVTGSKAVHVTKLAVLPSLAPDFEDVIVRSVVRRDFELTGMFAVIADEKAPSGMYCFNDPVDIKAWSAIGAEVIVKVAAKKTKSGKVKIFGLAYFLNHGKEPVYKKTFVVDKDEVRVTAHRITDALLGAITGRDGSFASHMTFASRGASNYNIFTIDADGHNIQRVADPADTSIAPTWGPEGQLFYTRSRNYAPFQLINHATQQAVQLPFKTSVYSAAFNQDYTKMAVAVAQEGKSAIYVGNADGSGMTKVSNTELATHPVFGPSGKLAWIGGGGRHGTQRVYVDGKPVSPAGFTAAAPAFCNTEDGVFLVFAVQVGGDRQDLIMSTPGGGNVTRLTQGQGSNSYPACSPDGRLLAFFSTRKSGRGLYVKSLKSFKSHKISGRIGQSLRWAELPPVASSAKGK